MSPYVGHILGSLLFFFPGLLGALAAGSHRLLMDEAIRRKAVLVIAGSVVVVSFLFMLYHGLDPKSNWLWRDALGYLLINASAPIVSLLSLRFFSSRGEATRAVLAIGFGLVPIIAGPVLLLLVHCTSGDCL